MYEKFTDRARKVMQLSIEEAQRFNHEYIGTEHVLLGLVKEGSGVAANALRSLGIDLRKIRLEVEKLVQSGPDMVTMGKLPQTPRAKKVIEYAMQEARSLNHNYVGTEHILLGLIREDEGVAAQILMNLGLKLQQVREEVLNVLGHGIEGAARTTHRGADPLEEPRAETEQTTSAFRLRGAGPLARHVKERRGRGRSSGVELKTIVPALSWFFLALGIVGLAIGITRDPNLALPGAVLIGASLVALALARR